MSDHPRDAKAKAVPRQPPIADEASPAAGGERVAKALARAGVASRREVERYIAAGRVALNGRVLDTPAVKVEPGDILTVDGAPVEAAEATRVWRYNKPAGLLTTNSDPQRRPTVFERLPADLPRVIAVGRLDLATEGLLILTNDGALSRALELPATGWVRRYRARAFGRITQEKLDALKDGVTVEGVRYGPIEARIDKATGEGAKSGGVTPANLWISIALAEGKNREVRRVLESLGLKVNRLIRLAYGPFALGPLPSGEVEEVGPRVIREQLEGLVEPASMPKGEHAAPRPRTAAGPLRRERTPGAGQASPGDAKGRDAPRGGAAKVKRPRGTLIEPPGRGGTGSSAKRGGAFKGPSRGERTAAPGRGGDAPASAKPARSGPRPMRSAAARPHDPRPDGSRTGASKAGVSRPDSPRPSPGSGPSRSALPASRTSKPGSEAPRSSAPGPAKAGAPRSSPPRSRPPRPGGAGPAPPRARPPKPAPPRSGPKR